MKQILAASKSTFSVTINLVHLLGNFKESQKSDIKEMIESYKMQLSKYFKVIECEGKPPGEEIVEVVFKEHKEKLMFYTDQKNIDGICEVLLSFRVNALQIAPELRKNLVYELIRNDLFEIHENENLDFLMNLIKNPDPKLRYAILPLVSIICSTLRGVEYVTSNKDLSVVHKVIEVLMG